MTEEVLVLASSSPRRRLLLGKISCSFQAVDSYVDESVAGDYSPDAFVAVLANRKAQAAAGRVDKGLVLAADTVIDFQGNILGKPRNDSEAFEMLSLLRGRKHHVVTGIAILNKKSSIRFVSVVSTEIRMKDCGDDEIEKYVATGEPRDKAGAYGIQGEGGRLIESVIGCYNNVVGLPLCETVELMRSVGMEINSEGACRTPSGSLCPRLCQEGSND